MTDPRFGPGIEHSTGVDVDRPLGIGMIASNTGFTPCVGDDGIVLDIESSFAGEIPSDDQPHTRKR